MFPPSLLRAGFIIGAGATYCTFSRPIIRSESGWVGESPRRFATTRWNLVKAAGRPGETAGAAALAALCEAYWLPVYFFVRRTCRSDDEARDLTQAFFARLIEKNDVSAADPARGRFRTFLLTSVRHFLANQHDFRTAQKRGGGVVHVPIEIGSADGQGVEPADGHTPEDVFERRWALATIEAAVARVRQHYADTGRQMLFHELRSYLTGAEPTVYADLAARLCTTEAALRVAVHRLRRAFREALREVILETVDGPDEVDDELRYLLAVVSR